MFSEAKIGAVMLGKSIRRWRKEGRTALKPRDKTVLASASARIKMT